MRLGVAIAAGAAAGLALGGLAALSTRKPSAPGVDEDEPEGQAPTVLPPGVEPPKSMGVPFAEGIARPQWPLSTRHPKGDVVSYRGADGQARGNWARRFAAPRDGRSGKRKHAGVDLFAFAGDRVLAMADGVITAVQSFHLGSWAVFVDHGELVVMYGEVTRDSWRRYGLDVGSRVSAGQPIAEVACMVRADDGTCRSHMLHLETYESGVTRNRRWYAGQPVPPELRDPSLLLLRAAHGSANSPAVV